MSRNAWGICLDCSAMLHSRDEWEVGSCSIKNCKITHINNRTPCNSWQRPKWRDFKNPVDEPDKYEWEDEPVDDSYPFSDQGDLDDFYDEDIYNEEDGYGYDEEYGDDYPYGSNDYARYY
jgi:hypothetical protein